MKVAAAIVLFVVAFAAALAWFVPASLIDRELDAATGGKVRFSDARGTLWAGRGIVTSPGSTWQVPVAFTIAKEDVLRGVHRVALQPVDGATSPRGTIEVVGDGMRIRDLAIDLPASALTTAMPGRGLPLAGGALAVTAGVFDWTAAQKDGGINARWRGARLVVGDTVADLGTVELAMSPRGAELAGRLVGSGGDVRIEGNVVASATGTVSLDATVAPAPTAPPAVAHALAALGTPDAAGGVRIAWRGALR